MSKSTLTRRSILPSNESGVPPLKSAKDMADAKTNKVVVSTSPGTIKHKAGCGGNHLASCK